MNLPAPDKLDFKVQRQSIWLESDKELNWKKLFLFSVVFHALVFLGIWSSTLFESEDVLLPLPPIMELVSVPPPPKIKPKVRKPQPPVEEVEPEIEVPDSEPEIPPEPAPKPPKKKPTKVTPPSAPETPEAPEEPSPPEMDPPDMQAPEFEETPIQIKAPPIKINLPQIDSRLNLFYATVKRKIMINYRPPKNAGVAFGTEFMFELTVLRAGGKAIGVKLKNSSGSKLLDDIAKRAIRLAQLPPIPSIFPKNETKLFILVKYEE